MLILVSVKEMCTWRIKVYVRMYKNICESSGDK